MRHIKSFGFIALSFLASACDEDFAEQETADAASAIEVAGLVINECRSGTSGWLELHNSSAIALDLATDPTLCWFVDDVAGGGAPKRITDAVVNHEAGSTTCTTAGRSATCGIVGPGERVWVNYAYVNATTADQCRLTQTPLTAGTCGTAHTDMAVGGPTTSTTAGQCFGRQPDGGPWQSGAIACTASGASNGGCVVGAACNDNSACTVGEAFDASCTCGGGQALSCDDGEVCTADSCDSALGCSYAALPDGTECAPGSTCETGECVASCTPGAACDDGSACTSGETFGTDCVCGGGTQASCDDGDPCSSDSCDAAAGCVSTQVPDGTTCGTALVCEAGMCVPTSGETGATMIDGAESRLLLAGTIIGPNGFFTGEVLIENNLITCVAPSCAAMPGAAGATFVDTQGIIAPGLIDSHNHGLFGTFDENDWTPTKLYTNHNQWTSEPRYKQVVDAKQYLGGEAANAPVDYRW